MQRIIMIVQYASVQRCSVHKSYCSDRNAYCYSPLWLSMLTPLKKITDFFLLALFLANSICQRNVCAPSVAACFHTVLLMSFRQPGWL